MADATLQILLKAIDQSTAVLKQVEGQLKAVESGQKSVTQSSTGMTAAAVAVGIALERMGQQALSVAEDVARMTVEWQTSTTALQNQADITDAAADQVREALLNMANDSMFGAIEMSNALAPVAGRLETATGAALDAAKATEIMTAAITLAEASESRLADSTSALVNVMLAYRLPLADAAATSDQLFNISRMTGIGLSELATGVDRLKDKLGAAAPDLAGMGAFLAELASQGLSGQRGLMAVSGAMATLTSQSDQVNTVLHNLGTGVFDAQGNFIGMRAVIAELAPRFAALTTQQQIEAAQTLFGAGAAGVMLNILQGGVATYDQFLARVQEAGTAEEAEARNEKTLADQLAILKNHVDALAIGFGERLAPAVGALIGIVNPLARSLEENKQAATVLAIIVGGVLVTAVFALTAAFIGMAAAAWTAFVGINAALLGIPIAIAAIVAAVYLLIANWDAVWGAMKAAPDFLRDHVGEILRDIAIFFSPAGPLGLIVVYWKQIFDHMPEPVQTAMNAVAGIFEAVVRWILQRIADLIDAFAKIPEAVGWVADALSNIPGVGELFGGAADAANGLVDRLHAVSDAARQAASDLNFTFAVGRQGNAAAEREWVEQRQLQHPQSGRPGTAPTVPAVPAPYVPPVIPPLPAGASAAISQATLDLQVLAAAFEQFHAITGGSIDDFMVILKLSQQRLDLDKRIAQAQIDLRVAAYNAADASYQLKTVWVELAEDAIRSGKTMNEELADLFGQLLSKWESQFNAILNRPTRESAGLQLRIDQLQLQKDLLLRGGASSDDARVKAIQAQIDALQQEMRIRQDQLAILKDQNQLMLAQNFSDADLIRQLQLTTLAEQQAMEGIKQFGDAAFQDAMNVRALGDAAYVTALQIIALGNATGQPVAGFQGGIEWVPRTMLARLHAGERVLNARQNIEYMASGRSGGAASPGPSYSVTIENHITATPGMSEEQMRRLARMAGEETQAALVRARFGGALPPSGAFG